MAFNCHFDQHIVYLWHSGSSFLSELRFESRLYVGYQMWLICLYWQLDTITRAFQRSGQDGCIILTAKISVILKGLLRKLTRSGICLTWHNHIIFKNKVTIYSGVCFLHRKINVKTSQRQTNRVYNYIGIPMGTNCTS